MSFGCTWLYLNFRAIGPSHLQRPTHCTPCTAEDGKKRVSGWWVWREVEVEAGRGVRGKGKTEGGGMEMGEGSGRKVVGDRENWRGMGDEGAR